jgi:hypothetical protein
MEDIMCVTLERKNKIEEVIRQITKNEDIEVEWLENNFLRVYGTELEVLRLVAAYKFNSTIEYNSSYKSKDVYFFMMGV